MRAGHLGAAQAGFSLLEALVALALTSWLALWSLDWLAAQRREMAAGQAQARAQLRILHLDSWLRRLVREAGFGGCAPGDLQGGAQGDLRQGLQLVDPRRPPPPWRTVLRKAVPDSQALQVRLLRPLSGRELRRLDAGRRVWVADCRAGGPGAAGRGGWESTAAARARRPGPGLRFYVPQLVLLYVREGGQASTGERIRSLYWDSDSGAPSELLPGVQRLDYVLEPGLLAWEARVQGSVPGGDHSPRLFVSRGLAALAAGEAP